MKTLQLPKGSKGDDAQVSLTCSLYRFTARHPHWYGPIRLQCNSYTSMYHDASLLNAMPLQRSMGDCNLCNWLSMACVRPELKRALSYLHGEPSSQELGGYVSCLAMVATAKLTCIDTATLMDGPEYVASWCIFTKQPWASILDGQHFRQSPKPVTQCPKSYYATPNRMLPRMMGTCTKQHPCCTHICVGCAIGPAMLGQALTSHCRHLTIS